MNEADGGTTRSKWQENHGNVLVVFLGVVLVLGAVLVVYRQNRAHKVQSPPDVRPRVFGSTPEYPLDEEEAATAPVGEDADLSPQGISELDAPASSDPSGASSDPSGASSDPSPSAERESADAGPPEDDS